MKEYIPLGLGSTTRREDIRVILQTTVKILILMISKRTLKLLFTLYVSKSDWLDKLGKFINIHFTVGLSEFVQSDSHLSFTG